MAFGIKQLQNPTPTHINRGVRIITVIIATFIAWMNTSVLIDKPAQEVINSVAGLILGLINGLSPLFGVDIQSGEEVPVSAVSSMDSPPLPYTPPKTIETP